MNSTPLKKHFIKIKLAAVCCIVASVAAFASLGDGGKHKFDRGAAVVYNFSKNFSLRSGFAYKSDNILNAPESRKFIMINTVVTYQQGNTTYIMPLKKKVLLDKITFKPAGIR